jgi:hypothetical protein
MHRKVIMWSGQFSFFIQPHTCFVLGNSLFTETPKPPACDEQDPSSVSSNLLERLRSDDQKVNSLWGNSKIGRGAPCTSTHSAHRTPCPPQRASTHSAVKKEAAGTTGNLSSTFSDSGLSTRSLSSKMLCLPQYLYHFLKRTRVHSQVLLPRQQTWEIFFFSF